MNVVTQRITFSRKSESSLQHGALLIFDETVTGFRFSLGGAQELFGVIPDLATFGKGLANGYPLSALVGSDKIMECVEHIFFSGTFGGESLSLAAAQAVINKLDTHNVLDHIFNIGQILLADINLSIINHELSEYLSVSGHPSWSFLHFQGSDSFTLWELKTLYLQEMFKRGIFTIGVHNLSFSHTMEDIKAFASAFNSVCSLLKKSIVNNTVQASLDCASLKPLFKVR